VSGNVVVASSWPERRQCRGGVRGEVETDRAGRSPVARVAAPARGVTVTSALVHLVAPSEQLSLTAKVSVVRSDEANGAVAVRTRPAFDVVVAV